MESEPRTQKKTEETVPADSTLSGQYFSDTLQRIGSPRLSRMAVPPVDARAL